MSTPPQFQSRELRRWGSLFHTIRDEHPSFGGCSFPSTAIGPLSFQALVKHSSASSFSSSCAANHTVPIPPSSLCTQLLRHFCYRHTTDVVTAIHTDMSFGIIAVYFHILYSHHWSPGISYNLILAPPKPTLKECSTFSISNWEGNYL